MVLDLILKAKTTTNLSKDVILTTNIKISYFTLVVLITNVKMFIYKKFVNQTNDFQKKSSVFNN